MKYYKNLIKIPFCYSDLMLISFNLVCHLFFLFFSFFLSFPNPTKISSHSNHSFLCWALYLICATSWNAKGDTLYILKITFIFMRPKSNNHKMSCSSHTLLELLLTTHPLLRLDNKSYDTWHKEHYVHTCIHFS